MPPQMDRPATGQGDGSIDLLSRRDQSKISPNHCGFQPAQPSLASRIEAVGGNYPALITRAETLRIRTAALFTGVTA